MLIQECVEVEVVRRHLKAKGTGVSLDTTEMPGDDKTRKAFRGHLQDQDIHNLILWWQFQQHTTSENCKLTDLLPSAAEIPRVRSFIEGDLSQSYEPVDLRIAQEMELVAVTNSIQCHWMYIIDGNHRAIAQTLQQLPFATVPIYVCVHPSMESWIYIPEFYKRLWQRL